MANSRSPQDVAELTFISQAHCPQLYLGSNLRSFTCHLSNLRCASLLSLSFSLCTVAASEGCQEPRAGSDVTSLQALLKNFGHCFPHPASCHVASLCGSPLPLPAHRVTHTAGRTPAGLLQVFPGPQQCRTQVSHLLWGCILEGVLVPIAEGTFLEAGGPGLRGSCQG